MEVEGLKKYYDELKVINNFSLNVENGRKISKNEIIENSFNFNAISLFNFFDAFGKKDLEKSIFFCFFYISFFS